MKRVKNITLACLVLLRGTMLFSQQTCPGNYTHLYIIETGKEIRTANGPAIDQPDNFDNNWTLDYYCYDNDALCNATYNGGSHTPSRQHNDLYENGEWFLNAGRGGRNGKIQKTLQTSFCLAECSASTTAVIEFKVRNVSNIKFYINEVRYNPDEGIDNSDLFTDDYVLTNQGGYFHEGENFITIQWDDLGGVIFFDNDSEIYFRAAISSSVPVYCCRDTDYELYVLNTDGDPLVDSEDAFPCDPGEQYDCDGDHEGDEADPDDDEDGHPDTEDAFDCNPNEWVDTDGDGIGDNEDPVLSDCCKTFQPDPGGHYWLSAWVKEDLNGRLNVKSYWKPAIELEFLGGTGGKVEFLPSGDIIDGWQRVVGEFTIPQNATDLVVNLINRSDPFGSGSGGPGGADVFFDDIRIHPFNASMKSYVYDPETLWLTAELDDNNYATFYEYDNEGKLIRIKKETARGIMTIQESRLSNPKGFVVTPGPIDPQEPGGPTGE